MDKASVLIRRHIDGSGNGFELDDLMSLGKGPVYEQASDQISKIHEEYKNDEYPIGICNPESFGKLKLIADDLEANGN